jgi:hypothetical protein
MLPQRKTLESTILLSQTDPILLLFAFLSSFWDAKTDSATTVTWEDNRTITCVVSIFGLAL